MNGALDAFLFIVFENRSLFLFKIKNYNKNYFDIKKRKFD